MTVDSSFCNVLANKPSQDSSVFDAFSSTFSDLTGAWEEFGKTGYLDPLNQHLKLAWDTSQSGTVDFTALAKASVSLLGLIPGVGPALPFINMFIGFVFPKIFGGASGQNANQAYFDLIMEQVKILVDNEFRDFTLNDLNNDLDGIEKQLSHFQSDMQVAIGHSVSPDVGLLAPEKLNEQTQLDKLVSVRESFKIARSTIETALPHFKNPKLSASDSDFNKETVMLTLPMYTIVATLDLVLQQGYILFANQWESVFEQHDYVQTLRKQLQDNIKSYTKTVSDTYNKFLPSLKKDNKDSTLTYNRYVRCMNLQCFDIVSTWPALDDQYYYNTNFKSDQTRLVFSDVAGPWEGNNKIFANVIDIFSPVPGGIGFKESSDLRTFTYKKMELSNVRFNSYYNKGKGKNDVEHGYCNGIALQYGGTSITAGDNNSIREVSCPITYLNIRSQNSMYLDLSIVYVDNRVVAGTAPIGPSQVSTNTAFSNQKINAIYPIQSDDKPEKHADTHSKWGFMSSHVPFDLFPENYIGDIDEKSNKGISIIKGFPLEKGHLNSGEMLYVSEPANSASAIKLVHGQEVALPIINNLTQKYRVRIRYSCIKDVKCNFNIRSGNSSIYSGNIMFSNTTDPAHDTPSRMFVPGNSGNFVLMELFKEGMLFEKGSISISISNLDANEVFLDRIEVISMP
ncbi:MULTISPECIES: insecticidal delta-endotoxin Cry8Ea1 family protein [unclassified Shewanella]|uniref:insecticidal delta-endotoxin Cry8Ea1 family protein n=1 Tax=unclassified Shewanella TaxID=196818 RepID=UPI0021D87DAA|nr:MULTISPECIES: insecticidal delta-endotoxin Cry8Ea1 family protein [unclassified Shewanella]MCU8036434.1 insecticidal delta-endotoxin Cry8Ea1 family protein [Shewanella sp. SM71]MCU8098381.1 insecticidal delta-endotoxin Cry8Ea1 family protein [Shewanella sp. SM102]